MNKNILVAFGALLVPFALGCSAKATDQQIDEMCQHLAELKGELRATSESEEIARVEEEHKFKEQQLKDSLARDLKGWDDVTKQRLADLEQDTDTEKTPEEKEEAKKKVEEENVSKKKEIEKGYESDFAKLGPNKERAIKDAKEYTAKRREKANQSISECAAQAKKEGVTEELANCRIAAETEDHYLNCR